MAMQHSTVYPQAHQAELFFFLTVHLLAPLDNGMFPSRVSLSTEKNSEAFK
jgi:hypothetical protein